MYVYGACEWSVFFSIISDFSFPHPSAEAAISVDVILQWAGMKVEVT